MPLQVSGRGKLTAEASTFDGLLRIRIDDDARPEFWCEVLLSRSDLEALLLAVDSHGIPE